ncbi:MAG: hypothetical protein RJA10_3406 [Pseudomonadota bacterium]|jgi:catechol 2,3-dioxygenase-like lactoylglutathione lyase family enzyme
MLPRLLEWFDDALGVRLAARTDGSEDFPSSLMSDDKLSVCESTITEYSRAIAAFDPNAKPQD